MPTFQEVKGSRREWETGKQRNGEGLWISQTSDDVGVPDVGDFFTDASGSTDTDIAGRVCVSKNVDPEVIPGIFFTTVRSLGFKAFT